MDDALVVRRLERFGDLPRHRQRIDEWQRTAFNPLRQRVAFDQFEHQRLPAARLFKSVDRGNVGMIEGGEHLRLAPESRQAVRIEFERARKHFQRHVAMEFAVARAEHLPHPAGAQQRDDAIRSDIRRADEGRARFWWRRLTADPRRRNPPGVTGLEMAADL